MKKVVFFITYETGRFHDYQVECFDPMPFFKGNRHGSWRDFLVGGLNRYDRRRALGLAEGVDYLYRAKDAAYMRFVDEFVDRYSDYDLIVLSTYNPLHPEVLHNELQTPVKILGFVDDPVSTYIRGIPYLWAFDGAFYVSPSYDERTLMPTALENWGCRNHYWFPLTQRTDIPSTVGEEFFANRTQNLIYVGKSYSQKMDRLTSLKSHFKDSFQVFGNWPLWGYVGLGRVLDGARPFWQRVKPISEKRKQEIYLDTKIGFNMHFSRLPAETGNMRMYETALHGMMLLCDKGGGDSHAKIFEPGREAVFYDSVKDAIEKAEYYIAHPDERIEIAWSGFKRAHRDYNWETNFKNFLDWGVSLKNSESVIGKSKPETSVW